MNVVQLKKEVLVPAPTKLIVQEDPFKYEGVIEIPDKAKRRPTTGLVISRGAEVTWPDVGDHILYAQFSGTGIQLKNQPAYRVLSSDEVLCKIKGDVEVEEVSA